MNSLISKQKTTQNSSIQYYKQLPIKLATRYVFKTNLIQCRYSSMWKGLDTKIVASIVEDEKIKENLKKFQERTTVKIVRKGIDVTIDLVSTILSVSFYPIKLTTKAAFQITKFPIKGVKYMSNKMEQSNNLLIKIPYQVSAKMGHFLIQNPATHLALGSVYEINEKNKEKQKKACGNLILKKEQPLDFKEGSENNYSLIPYPHRNYSWAKNVIFVFEKSPNPIIKIVRYATLIPVNVISIIYESFNYFWQFISSVQMAECVRQIKEISPNFQIEKFIEDLEHLYLPYIMDIYVSGKIQQVKPFLSEKPFHEMVAKLKVVKDSEEIKKKKLLHLSNVEFMSSENTIEGPILMFSFETDQEIQTLSKKSNQLINQEIQQVSYIITIRFEGKNVLWKIIDIIKQKTTSRI
ncbi:import inner membrane translocase subunit tim44 [Anaeramoeba ignava]|uniref:Import inner membrane translocase subunit tim44 n=1 Tax=Anaeramoeba ignava TaxID=1746090 RepID=A0A9Q0LCZ2_ANAIG|nr:import inner membrane translocase subunit tim44 [Anaeramoeba ignava]